jgi:ketosteroid isomerase-like protein
MPNNRQKNANAVNHFYQAIARGDVASARKVLHQELEWTTSEPSGLWFGGTYHGVCSVMNEVILPAYRWITDFRAEMERFLVSGEHVVAIGRFRGRTKTTGEELNAPTTHVWTFRNGKAMRVHTYHAPTLWLEPSNSTARAHLHTATKSPTIRRERGAPVLGHSEPTSPRRAKSPGEPSRFQPAALADGHTSARTSAAARELGKLVA